MADILNLDLDVKFEFHQSIEDGHDISSLDVQSSKLRMLFQQPLYGIIIFT